MITLLYILYKKVNIRYINSNKIKGLQLFLILLSTLSLQIPAYCEPINLNFIKQIESSGNPFAFNKKDGGVGLYQITPICLQEYNNFHPQNPYTTRDLYSPKVNERVARWYLFKRIPSMLKYYKKEVTIENIIISYNAGISYVVKGGDIPEITKRYIAKYNKLKKGRR